MAIIPLTDGVQWDSPRSFTATPIESNYGKSTLKVKTSNGLINQTRQQWAIRAIVPALVKGEVDAFLDECAGSIPFEFSPLLKQPGSFICKERQWSRLGIELGVVLWELSMTAEEFFAP